MSFSLASQHNFAPEVLKLLQATDTAVFKDTGLTVKFGRGQIKMPEIFIRPCYVDLSEIILRNIKEFSKQQSEDTFCTIVTGTPGIGKSTFTAYLIQQVASRLPDIEYLVFDNCTGMNFQFAKKNGMWYQTWQALSGKRTVYISDPKSNQGKIDSEDQSHHIVITSPNWDHVEILRNKFGRRYSILIMPVWEFEELEALNQTLPPPSPMNSPARDMRYFNYLKAWNTARASEVQFPEELLPEFLNVLEKSRRLDPDELERRYSWFGGVPRLIFSPDSVWIIFEDLRRSTVMKDYDLEKISKVADSEFQLPNTAPSVMLHMRVLDDTYSDWERCFGSKIFSEMIMELSKAKSEEQAIKFCKDNEHNLWMGPIVGRVFESEICSYLSNNQSRTVEKVGMWLSGTSKAGKAVKVILHSPYKPFWLYDSGFLPSPWTESHQENLFRPFSERHATYDLYLMAEIQTKSDGRWGPKEKALLGVQVTKAQKHSLALTGLLRLQNYRDNIIKNSHTAAFPVYTAFFVTADRKNVYTQPQEVTRSNKQAGIAVPDIDQLVVSFSYDELIPQVRSGPVNTSSSSNRFDDMDSVANARHARVGSDTAATYEPKPVEEEASRARLSRRGKRPKDSEGEGEEQLSEDVGEESVQKRKQRRVSKSQGTSAA